MKAIFKAAAVFSVLAMLAFSTGCKNDVDDDDDSVYEKNPEQYKEDQYVNGPAPAKLDAIITYAGGTDTMTFKVNFCANGKFQVYATCSKHSIKDAYFGHGTYTGDATKNTSATNVVKMTYDRHFEAMYLLLFGKFHEDTKVQDSYKNYIVEITIENGQIKATQGHYIVYDGENKDSYFKHSK